MEDSFANRLCSDTYLDDIRVTPPNNQLEDDLPHLTIDFRGREKVLQQAKALILKAAQEHHIEAKADIAMLNRKSGDALLSVAFYHLQPQHTPEAVLGIVHEATLCDIGATIKTDIVRDTVKKPDHDEDPINYLPTLDIAIQHKNLNVRKVVDGYLRRKLDAYFESRYHKDAGQLGMPIECFSDGNIKNSGDGHYEKIYLTFNEHNTGDPNHARMLINTAAEHLSGMLGIPERSEGFSKAKGSDGAQRSYIGYKIPFSPRPPGWSAEDN